MADSRKKTITYLSPAIPALSETFVYNEIFALRERGYTVHAISIHMPEQISDDVKQRIGKVHYLYLEGVIRFILSFLVCLFTVPSGIFKGLSWLIADFFHVGIMNSASYKLVYQFFASCRIAQIVKNNGSDHLHAHFANVPSQVAMYASAITGIDYTVTSHANDIFEHGLILKRKAERSKYFLTISEFNRKFLEARGLDKIKVRVVRCGVNLKFQERDKKPDKKFKICSLGRLVEKKGMPVLIEACAILKSKNVPFSLSIAGDGPQENILQKQIDDLSLSDSVSLLGAIDNSKVADWMSGMDVFALACQKDSNGDMDGIPVVLMEAMMLGLPVISTRISGIPELVIDHETGLLVEPNSPELLARAIERLYKDEKLRFTLTKKAAKHVTNEFSRDVNITRLEKYFNE